MGDDKTPPSLDDLEERLDAARKRRMGNRRTERDGAQAQSGLSWALRIGVELVSALVIGVGIGLLLDWWLGTRPWFMLVFLIFGAAAGMLNVYRVAMGFGLAVGYRKPDTDDDKSPETAQSRTRGRTKQAVPAGPRDNRANGRRDRTWQVRSSNSISDR